MNLYTSLLINFNINKKLIYNNKVYSYLHFINVIENISKKLNKIHNLKKILVITENPFFFLFLLYVAAKLGYTLITLNKSLSENQILIQINYSKPDCIIYSKNLLRVNKQNLKSVVLDDEKLFNNKEIEKKNIKKISKVLINNQKKYLKRDYIVTFSSGTTFKPKPILFTQKIKLDRYKHIKKLYSFTKKDNTLSFSPLDHSLGQRLFFLSTLSGSNFVYFDSFNLSQIKNNIKKYDVTFSILPSNYLQMLRDPLIKKRINIKKIVSAASTLDLSDKEILKKNNIKFHEMYGASEVGTVTSLSFQDEKKNLNSVGKIINGAKVKILSDDKKLLTETEKPGEIVCKTELKFKNYYKNKKLTNRSFFKGYFLTGDIGYIKKEYLYFLARKKDVIITSGLNIYPSDIERELNKHKNIKECSVIGLKDLFFGEAVFAICVLKKNSKNAEYKLNKFLLKTISYKQLPLGYSFIKNLPKSVFGKILKKELKEIYDNKKLDLSKKIRLSLN